MAADHIPLGSFKKTKKEIGKEFTLQVEPSPELSAMEKSLADLEQEEQRLKS